MKKKINFEENKCLQKLKNFFNEGNNFDEIIIDTEAFSEDFVKKLRKVAAEYCPTAEII